MSVMGRSANVPPAARSVLANLRSRQGARRVLQLAFLAAVAYLILSPLFRVQSLALEDGASAYRRVLEMPGLSNMLWDTLWVAGGSLLIALFLGTSLAWLATMLPVSLSWLSYFPVLPVVFPSVAFVLGWAFLLAPGPGYVNTLARTLPLFHGPTGPFDVYSLLGIVAVSGIQLTSFVYLFVRSGLRSMNPELLDAAEVHGSTPLRTFATVTLPVLRPVMVYSSAIVLLLAMGQVTTPLFLGRREAIDTLSVGMVFQTARTPIDYGLAAALGSPMVIIGISVIVLQRFLLRSQDRYITHSGRAPRAATRRSKTATLVLAAYGLSAVLLPLGALATVALSPFWSGSIDVAVFSLDNFHEVLDRPGVFDSIRNSVTFSLAAVAIVLPLGFIAATLIYRGARTSRFVGGILDFIVNVPLGIPAVIFGAGVLFTYTTPPLVLYGTPWVIILVYVTLMFPFATRFQLSTLVSLGAGYEEASWVLGGGFWRTKVQIILPLLRPAMAASAILILILLTHEFSASLLVRSVTTQVMGTQLYDLWTFGSYSTAAAFAFIMSVITLLGIGLVFAFGGRDAFEQI